MELRLRPWRGEDAADITTYAADWAVARWLRDVFPHPYTQKDAVAAQAMREIATLQKSPQPSRHTRRS